jgi:protein TonB
MYVLTFLWSLALFLPAQPAQTPSQTPSGEPIYKIAPENGIRPARVLYAPEPDYSLTARRNRIQGVVTLEGYIAPDGKYHSVRVIVPLEKSLDENALAAVKKWKFAPCRKDDKPVNCTMKVEVSYRLR